MSTKEILKNYQDSEKKKEEKVKKLVEEFSSEEDKEEEESIHYSKFAEEGTEAVKVMTGFYISEFLELYSIVEKALKMKKRGKKADIGAMDAFFLSLVVLKHYEKWDKFAVTYGVKRFSISSFIEKALQKILKPLTDELIKPMFKDEQTKKEILLKDFLEVGLIVDVTFQTRTRPTMLFKEAQYYFSGKHHCYGFKTEVAHLPNGVAAFVSDVYAGSVHDFAIFKDSVEIYKEFLEKKGQDLKIKDDGELKREYPKHWALMADKGYQGAAELIRAIIPAKGKELDEVDTLRNKRIARNRIICENFYGRMKKLFKIMEDKFRWDEEMYPIVFKICVALTNYHIMKYPLRNEDGIYYNAVLQKYSEESLNKKRKQQEKSKAYRAKRNKHNEDN